MTGMDSASHEYADNLKIAERFFLKTSRSGFLFAVCNDELVQREVNSALQFLLQGKGKTLHVHTWQKGDEAVHPLEQLRLLKKSLPNLAGFILVGLDSALFQNPDLLVQLNFGREALSELGIPILFWLTTRTLQRISNEAIDLYNQRVGANLYFEQAPETTDTDNTLRRYVAQETVRSNDNIRYLEARMKLLQQQLDEAEQQKRDPVVIANEIVLDLLLVYTEIPGTVQLIQELIDRYFGAVNLEKPANCAIVAKVFEYFGEIGKALGLYEKALNRYRDLAKTHPQTYLPNVAMTLNNLAVLQSDKNDDAGAEQSCREALGIYRDLLQTNPQIYLPRLAITLNNLAILQSDRNDYTGAEQGYREALGIYRELAKTNPQTYLPYVAGTLNNLANLQKAQNDYAGAEQSCREALGIYRDLLQTNPQTYLPNVAMTLNNLAVLQSDKNDYTGAEQGYREALNIYRELAKTNSQTYLPYVAGTLNNLSNLQKAQHDYAGAEQGYREALGIYRDLAQMNPQTYLHDEARALINVGWFYHDAVPDKQKSLDVATEVLRIVWPLKEKIPVTKQYAELTFKLLNKWGIDPEEFVKQLHLHE